MPPKNSGGSTKFPGGHKVINRTAQTAFVRVVIPRDWKRLLRKLVQKRPRHAISYRFKMFQRTLISIIH